MVQSKTSWKEYIHSKPRIGRNLLQTAVSKTLNHAMPDLHCELGFCPRKLQGNTRTPFTEAGTGEPVHYLDAGAFSPLVREEAALSCLMCVIMIGLHQSSHTWFISSILVLESLDCDSELQTVMFNPFSMSSQAVDIISEWRFLHYKETHVHTCNM